MEPLKVLVITSRPLIDQAGHALQLMSVAEARRLVRKCFKAAEIPVQIKFVPLAAVEKIKNDTRFEFDILYYFGYGDRAGSLYLEDGSGKAVQVDPSKFADLFNLSLPPKPKLIILPGHHSELIAGRLYDYDVPSLAVMGKKPVNEKAMIRFHQSFFVGWTRGLTLSESFSKGVEAVRHDPEVGDRACGENFLYSNDPVPFSGRFFLFSSPEQRVSRLIENRDNEGEYQEYLEAGDCFLPHLSERFIGREREIYDLLGFLKKNKITVISGETGKTELVKAVGWYSQERGAFKEGIYWAGSRKEEIRYPFNDFETFLNSILLAKTGREVEHLSTEEKYREVKKLFDSGKTLLVLNNLGVIEGDAGFLRLLTELSPEGRVLIASTHDLPARLVHNYRIAPLAPCPGFLEKVLAGNGEFQEYPQKMDEAADCERRLYKLVDGHIAALELTAGSLINKSFDNVRQELSETRPEGGGASETVVREAKALLTAFELNSGDLTPEQEKVFLGLSLFFGPADARAVREILAVDDAPACLEVLVRRSLIKEDGGNYYLLTAAREFARQKIRELEPETKFIHQNAVEFYKRQTDLSILYLLDHLSVLGEEYGERSAWREMIRYASYLGKSLLEGYYWRRAGQVLKRGLKVAKILSDKAGESRFLVLLGKLCCRKGEVEQAREYYRSSLDIFQKIGDKHGEAEILFLLGNIELERAENPEEALEAHRKSLSIYEKLDDLAGQVVQLSRVGEAYAALGRLDEALNVFLNRQKLQESLGDLAGQADSWELMAGVYEKNGDDLKSAIFYRKKAFLAFRGENLPGRLETAAERLKRLYRRLDER